MNIHGLNRNEEALIAWEIDYLAGEACLEG